MLWSLNHIYDCMLDALQYVSLTLGSPEWDTKKKNWVLQLSVKFLINTFIVQEAVFLKSALPVTVWLQSYVHFIKTLWKSLDLLKCSTKPARPLIPQFEVLLNSLLMYEVTLLQQLPLFKETWTQPFFFFPLEMKNTHPKLRLNWTSQSILHHWKSLS